MIVCKKKSNEKFLREVSELTGEDYTFLGKYESSKVKIPVRHNICGYEYDVYPGNFLSGYKCARCSGQEVYTDEEFKRRVKELVGDDYTFQEIYVNSSTKLSVKHNKCGNMYGVIPNTFLRGSRCPYCKVRKKKKSNEQFIKEVKERAGDDYTFQEEYKGAQTKIKVRHNVCGFEFMITPSSFLNKAPCRRCSKTIKPTTAEFKKIVEKSGNGEYEVLGKYINNLTKVKMKHKTCGYVYSVIPSSFTSGTRCPRCISSRGEERIADYLDKKEIIYQREKMFLGTGGKRFDFYIEKINLCIEYDGEQHFKPVKHWGGEEALRKAQKSDLFKNEFCNENGIELIRIPYWDFERIEFLLDDHLKKMYPKKESAYVGQLTLEDLL